MLKIVFFTSLMILSKSNWLAVEVMTFSGAFIMVLLLTVESSMGVMGAGLGVDFVGYILILLSFWIMGMLLMASRKFMMFNTYPDLFLLNVVVLLLSLVLTFSCLDYITFYICFESSLIPTLILILGWGYQPERLQAGVYMLFYTLFASLPLLLSLMVVMNVEGSLSISLLGFSGGLSSPGYLWMISSMMAFVVKLPLFMVHLWLPKAHVEAPVAGSMVLAGVLLKLGGYGLLRIFSLFVTEIKSSSWLWVSLGLLGGVMVSLNCLRQVDIKALIAYSSVAHMGIVFAGLSSMTFWGISGAVVVMVGHGMCSSGLFCLANIGYERVGSRSLYIAKGMLNLMPSMGLWWFLLSIGNMAAPPTLNLLGEVDLIIGVMSWSFSSLIIIALLSFFSVTYSLYMYSLSQHGKFYSGVFSCCSGKVREYLLVMLHWLPLNILILKCMMLTL